MGTYKKIFIPYKELTIEELNDEDNNLMHLCLKARENAYAPYSSFLVGCSVLLENGSIVCGNNQENRSYPEGLCAERVALYSASSQFRGIGIKKIFVCCGAKNSKTLSKAHPCGGCRQVMLEMEQKQNTPIQVFFLYPDSQVIMLDTVKHLLPFGFEEIL
ncbi:MAG: cytidine deaminase [Chitinophagaceae bacterium]|nr:cytidine deaminase [Chitinophagaceae bacterium]